MEHLNSTRDKGGSKNSETLSETTAFGIKRMATTEDEKLSRAARREDDAMAISRINSGTTTRLNSGRNDLARELTAQTLLRDRSLSSSRKVSLQAAELAKLQASIDSKRGLKDRLTKIVNEIASIGDLQMG